MTQDQDFILGLRQFLIKFLGQECIAYAKTHYPQLFLGEKAHEMERKARIESRMKLFIEHTLVGEILDKLKKEKLVTPERIQENQEELQNILTKFMETKNKQLEEIAKGED